ncbi:hypothetical protein ACRDNQ_17090 [Palleronia sp. KMU-117]|uniref:hypothetical protein n=1 Tax=Palleronia sp. KMU-117 TaxID=3434108 RepID=UPI003D708FE9
MNDIFEMRMKRLDLSKFGVPLFFLTFAALVSIATLARPAALPPIHGTGSTLWYNAMQYAHTDNDLRAMGIVLERLYPDSIGSNLQNSEIDDKKEMAIEFRDGAYFWTSNGNKELKLRRMKYDLSIEGGGADIRDRSFVFYVFEALDKSGVVAVLHNPSLELDANSPMPHLPPCYRGGKNYIEYVRLRPGGPVTAYLGRTDPYPYPKKDSCVGH